MEKSNMVCISDLAKRWRSLLTRTSHAPGAKRSRSIRESAASAAALNAGPSDCSAAVYKIIHNFLTLTSVCSTTRLSYQTKGDRKEDGPQNCKLSLELTCYKKTRAFRKMLHCPYKTRMVTSLSAGIRRRDRAGEAPAAAARAESSSSLDRLPALNPALGVSRPLRSSLHIINTERGAEWDDCSLSFGKIIHCHKDQRPCTKKLSSAALSTTCHFQVCSMESCEPHLCWGKEKLLVQRKSDK